MFGSIIKILCKKIRPCGRRCVAYGLKILKSNSSHRSGNPSNNNNSNSNPKEVRRKMTLPSRTRSPSDSFAEVSRRLANSTEGRFTIIDERSKDSESFDDASSTDSDDNKFSRSFVSKTTTICPSPIPIPLTVPRPANSTHLPLPQIRMTNSTGRFRVGKVLGDPGAASVTLEIPKVPTEKRIKRGRWECKEWYDNDLNDSKRQAKAPLAAWNDISIPVPTIITPPSNNNTIHSNTNHSNSGNNMLATNLLSPHNSNNHDHDQQQHSSSPSSTIHSHPPLSHENTIFSMEDQSDDSDRENNLPEFNSVTPGMDIIQPSNPNNNNNNSSSSSTPTNPSTSIEKPNSLPIPPVVNIPTSRSKLFGTSPDILSGRATPLEMQLHYGLERSLSGGGGNYFYPLFDPQSSSATPNGIGGGGGGGGVLGSSVSSQDYSTGNANSQIIAIDSKIEQAMDLVKTHLMFAVREEVEILRAKIVELDSTIAQLQSENAILREHVPAEILQNLDHGRSPSPALSTTPAPTTNAIVAAQ